MILTHVVIVNQPHSIEEPTKCHQNFVKDFFNIHNLHLFIYYFMMQKKYDTITS